MIKNIIDNILNGLRQRFESIETITQEFSILKLKNIYF